MKIQYLISFNEVARQRNISKAATVLGLGQPAVTGHIKSLEKELGVVLFDRIKRPLLLTSDGTEYLEMVAPIVAGLAAMKTHADHKGHGGSLTIAAYSDLVLHFLPEVIQSYRTEYPDVHIRLLAKHHSEMIQMTKSGEVDLTLSSPLTVSDPSLEFVQLFESSTMLLLPPGHVLSKQDEVDLAYIARYPLILYGPNTVLRARLEHAFAEQGLDYDIVMEMDNAEFLKRYVRIGIGIGLCGNYCLDPKDRDELRVVDFKHILSSLVVGIHTLRGRFQSQPVRNFIETLRKSKPLSVVSPSGGRQG